MPNPGLIQRIAATLRTALIGQRVLSIEVNVDCAILPREGCTIEEVRVEDHDIEIIFDDDVVLSSTTKRNSVWHVDPIEQANAEYENAQLVIKVANWKVTCCDSKRIDVYHGLDQLRHPLLGKLGPDLALPDQDIEECVRRLTNYADKNANIAEVLLDLRVMQGIGNVNRCELLWSCEIHPWARLGALSIDDFRELVGIAKEMVSARSIGQWQTLAVYGKHGKECARCGGLVRVTHHGEAHRVLYWCADCQTRFSKSSRYVMEHDTPAGIHPAEYLFIADLARVRESS